jgi:hypothetical protein
MSLYKSISFLIVLNFGWYHELSIISLGLYTEFHISPNMTKFYKTKNDTYFVFAVTLQSPSVVHAAAKIPFMASARTKAVNAFTWTIIPPFLEDRHLDINM